MDNIQDWLGHRSIVEISFNEKLRDLKEIGKCDQINYWWKSVLVYPIEPNSEIEIKKKRTELLRRLRYGRKRLAKRI